MFKNRVMKSRLSMESLPENEVASTGLQNVAATKVVARTLKRRSSILVLAPDGKGGDSKDDTMSEDKLNAMSKLFSKKRGGRRMSVADLVKNSRKNSSNSLGGVFKPTNSHRKSFKLMCGSISQICGACIYWRKLMENAIPADGWLRLSEKYLYPENHERGQPERPLSGKARTCQVPFKVSEYKAEKDRHKIVLPSRVIELLKINERQRTAEQSQQIGDQLAMVEQLENCFTKSQFAKFGRVAWFDAFGPCRVLIRQGQYADCFYLILSGKVNVKSAAGESSILSAGECFGIEELIADELSPEGKKELRRATYVSQTPVTVCCVHRCDFESRHNDLNQDTKRAHQVLNQQTKDSTEKSPLKGLFSNSFLRKHSGSWHFRLLPPKFRLCSDMKNSDWVYIVARGALTCKSQIPVDSFPKPVQEYFEQMQQGPFVEVGLATLLRGQCLGVSTCVKNLRQKATDELFDMNDWSGIGKELIVDKYQIVVESIGDTEVLMINKKLLRESVNDQLFWCLASQYESRRFPQLNQVVSQVIKSIEWERFKKVNMRESLKQQQAVKNR